MHCYRRISLLLVLVLVIGCAAGSGTQNGSDGGFKASGTGWQFRDIPAPRQSTFLEESSFYTVRSQYRIANLRYLSPLHRRNLVKFYRDQMRKAGWNYLNEASRPEEGELEFEKENERCNIVIQDQEDQNQRKMTIKIGLDYPSLND